jgi:peptidoglycan/LPS O-acetylase OafA/YrhL
MTSTLSLYLDALRFVMAFTVFLSHYGTARISGGLFWHFAAYGHTAEGSSRCPRLIKI